jgi:hypothetical protein
MVVLAVVAVVGNSLDALTMQRSSVQKSSYSGSNAPKYPNVSGLRY